MRYIKGLSQETLKILERIRKESQSYQVRQRAHCIRLSYEGYQIAELMKIFGVSRNTIYNWLNNWEKCSLVGLYNEKGRGRKAVFNQEEQQQIKQWAKETPKNIEKVREKIEKEWGTKVSKDTVKRVLKKIKMGWYRLKRTVAGSPIPEFYQKKKQQLAELIEKHKSINSYSPQLNKIEILWRLIKYQWLEPQNYESYSTLVEAVENILRNYGTKYTIISSSSCTERSRIGKDPRPHWLRRKTP